MSPFVDSTASSDQQGSDGPNRGWRTSVSAFCEYIQLVRGVVWQTPHSDDGEFIELELKFQHSRFPLPPEDALNLNSAMKDS